MNLLAIEFELPIDELRELIPSNHGKITLPEPVGYSTSHPYTGSGSNLPAGYIEE
jgi:hypothetical protein